MKENSHHAPDCYCDECQQAIAAAGLLLVIGGGGVVVALLAGFVWMVTR